MKTKGHRIFGCLLLVCVIGLTGGICASVANSKVSLSDAEMGSVYGGYECGPCVDLYLDGCEGYVNDCYGSSESSCDGQTFTESCKQTQKECGGTEAGMCEDASDGVTSDCDDEQYSVRSCKWIPESQGQTEGCYSDEDLAGYPRDCEGSRDWCEISNP